MSRKKLILPTFVLVVVVQLSVPAKMILDRENIIKEGSVHLFRTAPVDPYDPFRGKYIILSFADNMVGVEDESEWSWGESAYLQIAPDSSGFTTPQRVSKYPPDTGDYLEVMVSYVTSNGTNRLTINYPFDRFYMEESKAPRAERSYFESLRDSTQRTYAVVSVKNGEFVLLDVMIDGISITEIAEREITEDSN